MGFKQSYEQELQHIRTTAKEYAEKYPNIAPFLGNQSNDQDVERLIEAFAFTTAKLQSRLDDGVPELSQDIIRTTWPQMLEPITSKSIVQFAFNKSMKDAFYHIPVGQEITCKKNDQTIGFSTIYPLTLCALDLVNVKSDVKNNLQLITLDFKLAHGFSLKDMSCINLNLYCGGNYPNALNLKYLLTEKVKAISVYDQHRKILHNIQANLSDKTCFNRMDKKALQPDVFSLIPLYFTFPEMFNYIDLNIQAKDLIEEKLKELKSFSVVIELDLSGIEYFNVGNNELFINTVPVRNIDKISVSPVTINSKQIKYNLRIDNIKSNHKAIYQLNRVEAVATEEQNKHTYYSWHEFNLGAIREKSLYKQHVSNNKVDGRPLFCLTFDDLAKHNNLKISISASGFTLNAHEQLGLGDIKPIKISDADTYTYKNITHVTPSFLPEYSDDSYWEMVHYMSLRFNNINSIEALRKMILVFNAIIMRRSSQKRALTRKLCESLSEVKVKVDEIIHKRHVVRGNEIKLKIKDQNFINEGEMFLFGSILNEIFQNYAEVNSFNKLTVSSAGKGVSFQWPAIPQN